MLISISTKLIVLALKDNLKCPFGAILADAVGLGKTWSTLAVIKYFQLKGRETILLCPKKLEQNWKQFKKRQHSIFEEDAFDYEMNFHTDFTDKK